MGLQGLPTSHTSAQGKMGALCVCDDVGVCLRSGHNRDGGWGGIRTHGEYSPTPVFKTGALNRSATHPSKCDMIITFCDEMLRLDPKLPVALVIDGFAGRKSLHSTGRCQHRTGLSVHV